MNRLLNAMRSRVFTPIESFLEALRRDLVFRLALRRFMQNPEACAAPGNPVLADLIYGWGNEHWSALDEYLAACIRQALVSSGPILECGSGLSTLLVGVVARARGLSYWALEQSPEWTTRVQRSLARFKLASAVVLCSNPLRDYGDFCWYDPPLESMPRTFALVICDGPPRAIKGGRYGLVPIMQGRLKTGCVILLDDIVREQDRAVAERWKTELGASLELSGSAKPFIELTVMNSQKQH